MWDGQGRRKRQKAQDFVLNSFKQTFLHKIPVLQLYFVLLNHAVVSTFFMWMKGNTLQQNLSPRTRAVLLLGAGGLSGICSRTNKVGAEHNRDVSLPPSMFQEKMG